MVEQETNNPDGVASKIKTAVNESFETIAATINKLGEVGEGDTATERFGALSLRILYKNIDNM